MVLKIVSTCKNNKLPQKTRADTSASHMCTRGIWQLEKLTFRYCAHSGSSRGLRYALRTRVRARRYRNTSVLTSTHTATPDAGSSSRRRASWSTRGSTRLCSLNRRLSPDDILSSSAATVRAASPAYVTCVRARCQRRLKASERQRAATAPSAALLAPGWLPFPRSRPLPKPLAGLPRHLPNPLASCTARSPP